MDTGHMGLGRRVIGMSRSPGILHCIDTAFLDQSVDHYVHSSLLVTLFNYLDAITTSIY